MFLFLSLVAGVAAYPAWMGANHAPITKVAIYALALTIGLMVVGPKSEEVLHRPSRGMMAVFSMVLAAGLTGISYALGWLAFG